MYGVVHRGREGGARRVGWGGRGLGLVDLAAGGRVGCPGGVGGVGAPGDPAPAPAGCGARRSGASANPGDREGDGRQVVAGGADRAVGHQRRRCPPPDRRGRPGGAAAGGHRRGVGPAAGGDRGRGGCGPHRRRACRGDPGFPGRAARRCRPRHPGIGRSPARRAGRHADPRRAADGGPPTHGLSGPRRHRRRRTRTRPQTRYHHRRPRTRRDEPDHRLARPRTTRRPRRDHRQTRRPRLRQPRRPHPLPRRCAHRRADQW